MAPKNISDVNGHFERARPMSNDPAARSVQSTSSIRNGNRDRVLELLRRNQPISRIDIARKSGLQRSTISSIVDDLIEERWVCEGAVVKTDRGRRPTC